MTRAVLEPFWSLDRKARNMKISRGFLTLTIVIACLVGRATRLAAHNPVGTRVTWTGDVARIFQARCVSCHKAGSQSPMPLTTYDEVRPWVAAIRQQVLSRKCRYGMPFVALANSATILHCRPWKSPSLLRGRTPEDRVDRQIRTQLRPRASQRRQPVRSTRLRHNS